MNMIDTYVARRTQTGSSEQALVNRAVRATVREQAAERMSTANVAVLVAAATAYRNAAEIATRGEITAEMIIDAANRSRS